ncbi:21708_t:CDS:2, partial [Cetraspora pellucida]
VSTPWWPMFLEAPKEVVELPPAEKIILPGPSVKWANELADLAINKNYRLRLLRAQYIFEGFCSWLEMVEKLALVQDCLETIIRMHKER